LNRPEWVGTAAAAANAFSNVAASGGDKGIIGFAANIGSMLAPELAPLLQAGAGVLTGMVDRREAFEVGGRRRFQAGGKAGYDIDESPNIRGGGSWWKRHGTGAGAAGGFREQLGFGIEQFSDMYAGAARQGVFERSGHGVLEEKPARRGKGGQFDAGSEDTMIELMLAERAFGMGSQMTRYLGLGSRTDSAVFGNRGTSTGRGRPGSDQTDPLGRPVGGEGGLENMTGVAMGLAMQEGISRARLPEILQQLTETMERNTMASTDLGGTADRFLFISQLGHGQFKGHTAASREMDQTIRGLAQSSQWGEVAALKAAGIGTKGYAQASEAVDTGMDVPGGYSHEEMLKESLGPWVDAYGAAEGEEAKANIVLVAARVNKIGQRKMRLLLHQMAKQKGVFAKVDVVAGRQRWEDLAHIPGALIRKEVGDAQGQAKRRFGVGEVEEWDADLALKRRRDRATSDTGKFGGQEVGGGGPGGTDATYMAPDIDEGSAQFMQNSNAFGDFGAARPTGPHRGIDSAQAPGTPIYAWQDGSIVGFQKGYPGNIDWGFGVNMKNRKGEPFSQFHMDIADGEMRKKKGWLKIGNPVRAGITQLGIVGKPEEKGKHEAWAKKWTPHVHIQAGQGGRTNPRKIGNMDKVLGDPSVRGAGAGGDEPPPTAPAAPAPAPTGGDGPSSMLHEPRGGGGERYRVDVHVYDGRIKTHVSRTAPNRPETSQNDDV
jgi:murein DD-endopeptidase MepM/ murein hydrolase activator NlpD